jgi:putative tryptophan/tyrosine transport system substrate-binding protein
VVNASSEHDIEAAFATLTQLHLAGLVISSDDFFDSRSDQLAALALRHAMPAIYRNKFAAAGGLMSYSTDIVDQNRQAASYVDRILRGANPADLPVQAPTKYETTLNLKTAKALGASAGLRGAELTAPEGRCSPLPTGHF